MRVMITTTYEDGSTVDSSASTVDLAKWEDKYDRSVAELWDKRRLNDFLWMAWHSLARRKLTDLDYDSWLETVDTITIGEDDDPAPLESTPSTGRS